ncbi:sensor histidine kinase [Roseivirga sp. E12]|uniref:sensor histidine kinase n=1 Tax=Roseivirga sp. E12 TaxID=2819237 RepID=UPI001ABC790D|nr:histidine kinase [Roseivirga sp. E12]MBO3698220.1 histidine kinase [Roseivirga sp. E12]
MRIFYKIINSKWLQHPVFWVLSIYAIGDYFSISNFFKFIDFFYSCLFHIPLFFLVYINLAVLVPRFLQKGKYLQYGFLAIVLMQATYGLHELTFEVLLPLLPTEYYMVSFTDYEVLVTVFLIYLVLTTLFKLSKSWYQLQRVEKEKLSIELNSLKSQVNPHFLFNSLNSIYSLALSQSDQTAETVLELSNLLRYMLYEVGDDKVELSKELEMLENYIELQKLRADQSTKVTFNISGDPADKQIAPLLFFPLIENSFKHGVKGVSDDGFIDLQLDLSKGIELTLKNNKGQVDDMEEGKYGGIGLENVKRRLALIYPGKHIFEVNETDSVFEVKLTIQ